MNHNMLFGIGETLECGWLMFGSCYVHMLSGIMLSLNSSSPHPHHLLMTVPGFLYHFFPRPGLNS